MSAEADANNVGTVHDPHLGWAFHDYCPTEDELQQSLLCPQLDEQTVSKAMQYGTDHSVPTLMTEFGATQDQSDLTEIVAKADQHLLGWTEWAYTGNDKTSTSPDGQALVLDPAKPPRGANVERAKLKSLAEVYPKVIAGTPMSYSFTSGVFHLTYRHGASVRTRDGSRPGLASVVAVPHIQFPHGYRVHVSGARVVSRRDRDDAAPRVAARRARRPGEGRAGALELEFDEHGTVVAGDQDVRRVEHAR